MYKRRLAIMIGKYFLFGNLGFLYKFNEVTFRNNLTAVTGVLL